MLLFGAFGHKRQAAQVGLKNEPQRPAVYHQNLADLFRIRRMEKIIQQADKEIKRLKERVARLEEALARRNTPTRVAIEEIEKATQAPTTPPLPIAELEEIAAMARRFK